MGGEIGLSTAFHKPVIPVTGKPQLLYTLVEVVPLSRAAGARLL